MSSDQDLITKILLLPEQKRADFLQFFGVSKMTKDEMKTLESNLAASFEMKSVLRSAKAN